MRTKPLPSLCVYLLFVVASGCVSVDTSQLDAGTYEIHRCTNIYVQDLRPYIVAKKKKPDFLGIVRGGYGNPTDFTTSSGASLASQLGQAIAASLAKGSEKAEFKNEAVAKTSKQGCSSVVLSMQEWKIDAMVDAWFEVDADMTVYSPTGKVLASEIVKTQEAFDQGYLTAVGDTKENFINESQRVLAELLSSVSPAL